MNPVGSSFREEICSSPEIQPRQSPEKRPRAPVPPAPEVRCPICDAVGVDDEHVNACLDSSTTAPQAQPPCPICGMPEAGEEHVNKCLDSSSACPQDDVDSPFSSPVVCPICGEPGSPMHVDECIESACPSSPLQSPRSEQVGPDSTKSVAIAEWLGSEYARFTAAFQKAGIFFVHDIRNIEQPVDTFLLSRCGISALGSRKKLARRLKLFLDRSRESADDDATTDAGIPPQPSPHSSNAKGRPSVFHSSPMTESVEASAEKAGPSKTWAIFAPNFRPDPEALLGKKQKLSRAGIGAQTRGNSVASGAEAGGRERKQRQHAFSHRVPGTSFTVDSFRGPKSDPCRRFFLTHFHSDHYGGLSKTSMPPGGIVLCSAVTASLVTSLLRVPSARIQVLPSDGRSVDIVDEAGDGSNGVTVQCFNANHCPGAVVMLFFVWKTKRYVLHSGDCRFDANIFAKHEKLANVIAAGELDYLHLDTTYCDPRYVFPYQPTILERVVAAAQREDKRTRNRCLFLFGTYSIGKEKVFMAVAEALNLHIYCSTRKRGILEKLSIPGLNSRLVDKPGNARVHVVSMRDLSCEGMRNYAKRAGLNRSFVGTGLAVIVKPTGWTFSASGGDGVRRSVRAADQAITYDVAYSEHSSFSELQEFVAWAQPARIVPTVNCRSAADATRLCDLLGHKNRMLRAIGPVGARTAASVGGPRAPGTTH